VTVKPDIPIPGSKATADDAMKANAWYRLVCLVAAALAVSAAIAPAADISRANADEPFEVYARPLLVNHEDSLTRPGSGFGEGVKRAASRRAVPVQLPNRNQERGSQKL
jgi:hypothetical protein